MQKITLEEETFERLERSSESQMFALDSYEHRCGMYEIEVDDDIWKELMELSNRLNCSIDKAVLELLATDEWSKQW